MDSDILVIRDDPPSGLRRGGCLVSAVALVGIVAVAVLLAIPAVHRSRQVAQASQFT